MYAILDGTLIPMDRVADQKPYHSGKHPPTASTSSLRRRRRPTGLASPALPGATHHLVAARTHDLIDTLLHSNILTFADKGYQGAGGIVVTPFKHHSR